VIPEQHAEVSAGSEASNLLDSRGWQNARQFILDGLAQQRRRVAVTDTAMQAKLIMLEQMFYRIESFLEDCQTTGEWTLMQVEEEKQRQQGALERMSGWLRRT
jgi:hypothetical protein